MSRNQITLIASVLLMAVLAYFVFQKSGSDDDSGTLSDSPLTDYAIEDTASVDKIVIKDGTLGTKAVLEKESPSEWTVNGKYCARRDAINVILKTFKRIQVQRRVPKNAIENIIKSLATRKKEVEIYQDGELIKKWIVGNPTRDHYGTFMNLENYEDGKQLISNEPMVMELPGFNGHLWSRFFADQEEWRCTEIFEYNPTQIASIETTFPKTPEQSFKLTLEGDNKFTLYNGDGQNMGAFDTSQARDLFIRFRRVNFEQFTEALDDQQMDSLQSTKPDLVLSVSGKDGRSTTLPLWKIKVEDQESPEGIPLEYDPDRMFAITPDGELVLMQYFVLDPLVKQLSNFKRQQAVDKTASL